MGTLYPQPPGGTTRTWCSTGTLFNSYTSCGPLSTASIGFLRSSHFTPMRYLTWENVWLPRQLKADSIDVFHCPMNYGMPMFTNCPRVLTLHDVIDIVYYIRRMSNFNRLKPSSLRTSFTNWVARVRADRIITISEHAKRDIIKHLRVPNKKLTVVYEAADPQFHRVIMPAEIERSRCNYKLAKPYFFYLGGWEERKNLPFFLHCFAAASLADEVLVLGGGSRLNRLDCLNCRKLLESRTE